MNTDQEYHEQLAKVIAADPRYPPGAYDFVREAVNYSGRKFRPRQGKTERRHITGQQLLEGIRELALQEFGPMAIDVFEEWHITRTEDFGNIVFNLVHHNLLGASEEDSPDDFAGGYDFIEAFVKPFVEVGAPPDDLPKIT